MKKIYFSISLSILALFPVAAQNVGIGTTNPQEKLHINGSIRGDQGDGALRIQSTSGYMDVGVKNSNWAHFYTDRDRFYMDKELVVNDGLISSYDNDELTLRADYNASSSNDQLVLETNGEVGIGTSDPGADLHLYRTDSDIATLAVSGGNQGTGIVYVGQSMTYGGGIGYNGDGTPSWVGSTDDISFFRRDAGTDVEVFHYPYNSNTVYFNGNIDMEGNRLVDVNTPSAGTDAANKDYVDSQISGSDEWTLSGSDLYPNSTSYNVGIGLSNPSGKLHVDGDIVIDDNHYIRGVSDDIRFLGGNTTDDTNYEWAGFYSGNTRQGIILYDGQWSGANNLTNEFSITAENSNLLTLNTDGSHVALMPDGSGNVGVKDLSPDADFDVQGEARISSGNYLILGNNDDARDWGLKADGEDFSIAEAEESDKEYFRIEDDGDIFMKPNGATSVTFENGGEVGIGDQTPSNLLDINTIGTTSGIDFDGSAAITGTPSNGWLRLNQDQGFSNGTYSPGLIRGDGGMYVGNDEGWVRVGEDQISTVDDDIALNNDNITGVNELQINDPGEGIAFAGGSAGTVYFEVVDNANDNILRAFGPSNLNFDVDGRITSNGITETSDARFKKDIQPLQNSLEKLMALEGVSYYWNNDNPYGKDYFTNDKQIGVIAQQIEPVFPEVVVTDEEGFKSVQYTHLVPILIEAVKELKTENTELKAEVEDYKAMLENIDLDELQKDYGKNNLSAGK